MSFRGSAAAARPWRDDEHDEFDDAPSADDALIAGGDDDDDAGPAAIEVPPMEERAHRRLYLPVVRALPPVPVPRVLSPAEESVRFFRPSTETESGRQRAVTESMDRMSKRELEAGARVFPSEVNDEYDFRRPRTREDCLPGGRNEARPCPWVSCRHHLALDVGEDNGSIKANFPGDEVWGANTNCSLDVADRGGVTLEELGALMNVTRERARQLEMRALKQLREELAVRGLRFAELEALIEREERE